MSRIYRSNIQTYMRLIDVPLLTVFGQCFFHSILCDIGLVWTTSVENTQDDILCQFKTPVTVGGMLGGILIETII